jgi:hypothetical protein
MGIPARSHRRTLAHGQSAGRIATSRFIKAFLHDAAGSQWSRIPHPRKKKYMNQFISRPITTTDAFFSYRSTLCSEYP